MEMIKFVLGVVLGFLFSKEIENPRMLLDKIDIARRINQTNIVHKERTISNRIADIVYTVIG